MGKVIVLACVKGGVCKSTLVRGIASAWHLNKKKICVIDADPQGSIKKHFDVSGELKGIKIIADPSDEVYETIEENKEKYDYIIVDTGGHDNQTLASALLCADMALIPMNPSKDDIDRGLTTYNHIKKVGGLPERKGRAIKYRMMLTRVPKTSVVRRNVRRMLGELGYILMKNDLPQRLVYLENSFLSLPPNVLDPMSKAGLDLNVIANELMEIVNT